MAFTRLYFDETAVAPIPRTYPAYGPFGFGTRPFFFGHELILALVAVDFHVARAVGTALFADPETLTTTTTVGGFRVLDLTNQGDRIVRRSGFIVTE